MFLFFLFFLDALLLEHTGVGGGGASWGRWRACYRCLSLVTPFCVCFLQTNKKTKKKQKDKKEEWEVTSSQVWDISIWGVPGRADKEHHIITSLWSLVFLIQSTACLEKKTLYSQYNLNCGRDWNTLGSSNLQGSKATMIVRPKRLSATRLKATSDKKQIFFAFTQHFLG